jgi:uncharacterized membrane protein YozB (DUF420 family)
MSQPAFHALLNGTAAVLLSLGWLAIRGAGPWRGRGRQVVAHRNLMLAALAVSAVFLASYLHYHHRVGSVPYNGTGALRALYFAVLVPHVVLAALMVPMIAVTLVHALRGRLERHRRWARWTLPVWLYVSVTGVVVYLMLYAWAPGA